MYLILPIRILFFQTLINYFISNSSIRIGYNFGIKYLFNQIIYQEKDDIKLRNSLLNYAYSFYIFIDINKDNISNYTVNNSTQIKFQYIKSNA